MSYYTSLKDYPIYRGYPWGFRFAKFLDYAGDAIDLTDVSRVKFNLIRGPVGIGSTVALTIDTSNSPPRIAYTASVVIPNDGTYPGYTITLTEADTLGLSPGEYWAALELIRSSTTDDYLPILCALQVVPAGRTP